MPRILAASCRLTRFFSRAAELWISRHFFTLSMTSRMVRYLLRYFLDSVDIRELELSASDSWVVLLYLIMTMGDMKNSWGTSLVSGTFTY